MRRAKSLTINELRLWNIASPVPTYPRKKIKKVKKKVAIFQICDILFSVMRDMIQVEEVFESSTEMVSCTCCGCGEQVHIDHDEAAEWHNLENFMCWECE